MASEAERSGAEQDEIQVDPRFFTLEQTARYLNVSRPQVYALVRSGELPAIKLGGRGVWRVDRHQLDVYIEGLLEQTRAWAESHPLSQGRRGNSGEAPHGRPEEQHG
jgi:excisionase family DNA binding protein